MLTDLYETLSRADGGARRQWGRGVTPYGLAQHLGCSPKKAKSILADMERHNFMWSSIKPYRPGILSKTYYLNTFGQALLATFYHAANAPKDSGQLQLKLEVAS